MQHAPLPEGRDNGLLQAWEILEQVRLDADLVVLSGCLTGMGQALRGEGLIGLTRAFQYAGARTVAASLWEVADRTTAELMYRFYELLKAGKVKAAGLTLEELEDLLTFCYAKYLVEPQVVVDVVTGRPDAVTQAPLAAKPKAPPAESSTTAPAAGAEEATPSRTTVAILSLGALGISSDMMKNLEMMIYLSSLTTNLLLT